jgi:hypothetical protein
MKVVARKLPARSSTEVCTQRLYWVFGRSCGMGMKVRHFPEEESENLPVTWVSPSPALTT